MVNVDVFDHLGPIWARLDPFGPFRTKNDFWLKSTSAKPYFVLMGQQIDFCQMVKKCPDGPIRVPNCQKKLLGLPFWNLLDHFGMLTSLPCLAICVCFIGAFFLGHSVLSDFHFN